jgi:hypothetical protein
MNVEHRPTMEAILTSSPERPPQLDALAEWLATNDAALMLLPAGVDALMGAARAANDAALAEMQQQFSDPAYADMLAQMKSSMELYQKFLGFWGGEVEAGAVGVAIDDNSNVRIAKRIILEKDGRLATMADVPKADASPLAGFPAEPFVFAGGGPLPPEWAGGLAGLSRRMIEMFPQMYGFENLDEAHWKKLEDSWKAAMQMRAMAVSLLVGKKDDPLYSNAYMTFEVDDSAAYLQAARKSVETWNEMMDLSTGDIKIKYEFSELQIAGKPALLMITDVAAAAGDENVPMVKPMLEAMVGKDGKMRMYWVAADEDTVISAIGAEELAAQAVERVESGEQGLAQAADVQTTAALMDPAAPWTLYISPPGCVAWFQRLMTGIMGQIGAPMMITIPDYPAGPPVGISMNITGGQLHSELVVPARMLEDLAAYVKKVQGM